MCEFFIFHCTRIGKYLVQVKVAQSKGQNKQDSFTEPPTDLRKSQHRVKAERTDGFRAVRHIRQQPEDLWVRGKYNGPYSSFG